MENIQANQIDLITVTESDANPKIPLAIGITAISLLALSALFEFVIFYGVGLLSFVLAFVLSIIGVVVSAKFKNKHVHLSTQQNNKLKLAKWLSLITLIISSLIILGVISLIILIGNQVFGR